MKAIEKRAGALIRRLTEDDDGVHVSYDILAAFVDGSSTRDERREVLRHVSDCPPCAADLRDLRETADRVEPVRRAAWLWAAAAAVIVGITALFVFRGVPPASSRLDLHDAASTLTLDPRDAAAVRAALDHGTLEVAPAVVSLRGHEGRLMGTAAAKYDVVAPVATYVRETRPHFTWTPLAAAKLYRVEVYDVARRLVLSSPSLTSTSWTPDRDLGRGRDYDWQVVADEHIPAPAPPAPPARFGVLGVEAAARLEAVAQRYRGSHLLLAIAAAREGALDDARAELAVLQKLNPDSAAVARLVRALNAQ